MIDLIDAFLLGVLVGAGLCDLIWYALYKVSKQ